MKRKRLLIVNQEQFGYHSDTYYYCKYLRSCFDITYICWNYNKKKLYLNGIKIVYVSRKGSIALRNVRFIFQVISEIKKAYHFHIIKYFRGCSVLKFVFPEKRFLFDIRSASVEKEKRTRLVYDFLIKTESKVFRHISVISDSLAQRIGLSEKAYIIPLGAEVISCLDKKFDSMYLLYVGTLYNRNIDHTIRGFAKFYHTYKDKVHIKYTILGTGFENEQGELKEIIKQEKLDHCVEVKGYIPHDKLKEYFDTHNIGVAYIPITDYFNVQPATKIFEYLLSGMAVIATDTVENKAIINGSNGVLINDTPEGFHEGLVRIYKEREKFTSCDIRSNAGQYTWDTITDDLKSVLESLK